MIRVISDKTIFIAENIVRDEKAIYINFYIDKKVSIQQQDKIILDFYAPNNNSFKI